MSRRTLFCDRDWLVCGATRANHARSAQLIQRFDLGPERLYRRPCAPICSRSRLASGAKGARALPFLGLLPLVLYVGLLSERLEIELSDAIVVGLITFLVKMFIFLAIMSTMAS